MTEDEITISERIAIFKILYPTAEFDSLMESGHAHAEEAMDEIGIPKHRNRLVHVIGFEKPLKDQVEVVIKNYENLIWGEKMKPNICCNACGGHDILHEQKEGRGLPPKGWVRKRGDNRKISWRGTWDIWTCKGCNETWRKLWKK